MNGKKNLVLYTATLVGLEARNIPGARDIGTTPLDVFNHMGNVNLSAGIGVWAGYFAGKAVLKLQDRANDRIPSSTLRAVMTGAGLAVGVVLNALTETKMGISLSQIHNTPDTVDLTYGVIAAGAAAFCVPEVVSAPEEVDVIAPQSAVNISQW